MRFDTLDGDCTSAESRSLAQQNVDLRRRLDEEQAAYKRKLTAYQEGQQRQAQLVQKLQAKVRLFCSPLYPRQSVSLFPPFFVVFFFLLLKHQVLQYKKRCGELEQILQEKTSELDKHLLSVSETCSVFYSGDYNSSKSPSGCQRCL